MVGHRLWWASSATQAAAYGRKELCDYFLKVRKLPFWGWENEGNRWCLGGGGLAAYFQTSWFLTPWAMFVKVCSLRESVLTGRLFFPLKEIFPAVSPLSPMSGWQSWIAKYGYTNWEQHVIYIYTLVFLYDYWWFFVYLRIWSLWNSALCRRSWMWTSRTHKAMFNDVWKIHHLW